MLDINSATFSEDFEPGKATIGIVGQGFVGSAMKAYFDRPCSGRKDKFNIVVYDKFKNQGTLDEVVRNSNIIFVCVPTPMRTTGECYTGIVESVLKDISQSAKELGRDLSSFIVCVKSTVYPGFIDSQKARFQGMRLTFSPEFLREASAVDDMLNANRVVVGGEMGDAGIVLQFFLAQDLQRVDAGECILVRVEAKVAEMVKLYTNGILFTKVLFSNEVHQMCEKLGINYDDVRIVSCVDPRIGPSHTQVPGPDGFLGAGGHCFPKDMHNLAYVAAQLGTNERMFTAVLDRNAELREEKDWEKMNDRAVTNN
jgi:UDPglucose 6-dehydrogenase